jgi:hypothetical protein
LATLNYDTYPIRAAKESTVENANENSENSPVEEVHTIIMSAEQQAKVRAFWTDQNHRLLAMRSKDREFHGLQREFLYSQAEMLQNYEKSKDIQHPRDVGTTREAILGRFLEKSGYIPKRYSVSNTSVRVASTEGFISREIDILLFDRDTKGPVERWGLIAVKLRPAPRWANYVRTCKYARESVTLYIK